MKIDTFSGYIEYREKEHIFIFQNYELQLIPISYNNLIECKTQHGFKSLSKLSKNGWINDIILKGVCFDDKQVIFCIQDNPVFKDGVFSYKVKWLYINDLTYDDNYRIKGINFTSQEINCIYDLEKYISDDFTLENGCFKDYRLNIKTLKPEKLGNFKFSNYGVDIYGDMSWRKKYSPSNNFEIWSKLTLEFSRELTDLNKLYKMVLLQLNVINFLTYRLNNSFDMIETYIYDERKRKITSGRFFINYQCELETEYKNVQCLIKNDNIPNLGSLYKMIMDDKIYMTHICHNYSERKKYSPSRMLGIMIAFERLFAWQYGKESIRSKEYIELLEKIKLYLEKGQEDICNGLSKKSNFKKILKRLNEVQVDYGSCIRHVIKDISVCQKYIKNLYDMKNMNETINQISERVNKFRNDMAHGNMDIEISIEHTKDLKLIEIMVYIMILKYIGVTEEEIIKKLNWLFNIKTFFN